MICSYGPNWGSFVKKKKKLGNTGGSLQFSDAPILWFPRTTNIKNSYLENSYSKKDLRSLSFSHNIWYMMGVS